MSRPATTRRKGQRGFTLLEMLISLTLVGVLFGAVVMAMTRAMNSYRRSEVTTALTEEVRSAAQLLTQDIGQAGLTGTAYSSASAATQNYSLTGNDNPTPLTTLTAVSGNTATVGSTAGMFIGQDLLVGVGIDQQSVTVTAINSSTSFSAYFGTTPTALPEPIYPHGVFVDGVVPPTYAVGPSTAYTLHLYGDLRGNGMITVVDYVCPTSSTTPYFYSDVSEKYADPTNTGTRWGPLYRYEYDSPLTNPSSYTKVTLVGLVAVDSGCFTYTTATDTTGNVFVSEVTVKLRAMAGVVNGTTITPDFDPNTKQLVTMNYSFLNVKPRNLIAAYTYSNYLSSKSVSSNGELMARPTLINNMIGSIP